MSSHPIHFLALPIMLLLLTNNPINFQVQISSWSSFIWLTQHPWDVFFLRLWHTALSGPSTFPTIPSQSLWQNPAIHIKFDIEFCHFQVFNMYFIFPLCSFHTIVALAQILYLIWIISTVFKLLSFCPYSIFPRQKWSRQSTCVIHCTFLRPKQCEEKSELNINIKIVIFSLNS